MKLAGLSIDVDSVSSHLEGYGFERPPDDGAAYRLAVPRLLDLLDANAARCTFFLIAEEAREHPETVREIRRRGHEVASHSMTHRLPFADLDERRAAIEVAGSKALLEELGGGPVVGFRAPSWDLSPLLFRALVGAGYVYDASTYPSLLLPLLRRTVAKRSPAGRVQTRSSHWAGVFGPTRPHLRRVGGDRLVEVPMCTAPWTRLPYYHTLGFVLPAAAFGLLRSLTHLRRGAISYQFHAVDLMGLEEDRLDPRIARHPGMRLALPVKLELARRAIARLARGRRVVPLCEIAEHYFRAPHTAVPSIVEKPA